MNKKPNPFFMVVLVRAFRDKLYLDPLCPDLKIVRETLNGLDQKFEEIDFRGEDGIPAELQDNPAFTGSSPVVALSIEFVDAEEGDRAPDARKPIVVYLQAPTAAALKRFVGDLVNGGLNEA